MTIPDMEELRKTIEELGYFKILYMEGVSESGVKTFDTAIKTCESVLAASECFGEKLESGLSGVEYCRGRNEARDEDTATLAKKLLGVSDIIKNHIEREEDANGVISTYVDREKLNSAITKHLGAK